MLLILTNLRQKNLTIKNCLLQVDILDVNDESPIFNKNETYDAFIKENSPPNSPITYKVKKKTIL